MAGPEALFRFDSIAVVGASEDPTRLGGTPIALLERYGYPGRIIGVNPKNRTVQGHPCVATVDELPEPIDAVAFCLPARNLTAMLPVLKRKGMKGLVVFSAGFGESGAEGARLQAWLHAFARENEVALLGPNCAGLISFATRRAITFASAFAVVPVGAPGRVALLSQSGGVAVNIWADAALAGARFSHVITTGNEADQDFAGFLDWLAEDPDTDAVVGYLEGLRSGAAFCDAAARLRAAGKPLVLMKVGRSAVAQDAAASHTAQLASDDAGFQAAFERHGVVRVHSFQELVDASRVLSAGPKGRRVTIATNSGGAGVYIADLCDELGLPLAQLSVATEKALATMIPSFGRVRNPVDLTAQVVNDMSFLERCLKLLLDDPAGDVLVFAFSGKGREQQAAEVIDMLCRVSSASRKKVAVCWLGVPQAIRQKASDAGLLVYADPAAFLRPLAAYADFRPVPVAHVDAPARAALSLAAVQAENGMLAEPDALALLEQVGVECVRRWRVRSEEELRACAAEAAFPCVMKISRPVFAHKSDVGGVVLGLRNARELRAAWKDLRTRLHATEVLVAEQVQANLEVLVGWVRDAAFGVRLTLGCGGIWANYVAQVRTLVPPFDRASIRAALHKLPFAGALEGRRGQPSLAVEALVSAIAAIGESGIALREALSQFECNPILVTRERAVVADAIGFAVTGEAR